MNNQNVGIIRSRLWAIVKFNVILYGDDSGSYSMKNRSNQKMFSNTQIAFFSFYEQIMHFARFRNDSLVFWFPFFLGNHEDCRSSAFDSHLDDTQWIVFFRSFHFHISFFLFSRNFYFIFFFSYRCNFKFFKSFCIFSRKNLLKMTFILLLFW